MSYGMLLAIVESHSVIPATRHSPAAGECRGPA